MGKLASRPLLFKVIHTENHFLAHPAAHHSIHSNLIVFFCCCCVALLSVSVAIHSILYIEKSTLGASYRKSRIDPDLALFKIVWLLRNVNKEGRRDVLILYCTFDLHRPFAKHTHTHCKLCWLYTFHCLFSAARREESERYFTILKRGIRENSIYWWWWWWCI